MPKYRHHKASGRAVVTLSGKDYYLGVFGSSESKQAFNQRVAEWLASGCPTRATVDPRATFTINDLVLAYWRYVKQAYSPQTRDGTIGPALRRLRRMYGQILVTHFGPLRLKAYRQSLIDERIAPKNGKPGPVRRLSRRYVNRSVQEIRRMFRWGVGEELVSPAVLHGLQAVEGLRIGRTDAPETEPVRGVPDTYIEATLPELPPVVADMVRIQRLTGMRPGELCSMTCGELDTTGDVWLFSPRKHKTAHHGKTRQAAIGPRAQDILRKYLKTDLAAPLFNPAEAEEARKAQMRQARKSQLTPSQRVRDAKGHPLLHAPLRRASRACCRA